MNLRRGRDIEKLSFCRVCEISHIDTHHSVYYIIYRILDLYTYDASMHMTQITIFRCVQKTGLVDVVISHFAHFSFLLELVICRPEKMESIWGGHQEVSIQTMSANKNNSKPWWKLAFCQLPVVSFHCLSPWSPWYFPQHGFFTRIQSPVGEPREEVALVDCSGRGVNPGVVKGLFKKHGGEEPEQFVKQYSFRYKLTM